MSAPVALSMTIGAEVRVAGDAMRFLQPGPRSVAAAAVRPAMGGGPGAVLVGVGADQAAHAAVSIRSINSTMPTDTPLTPKGSRSRREISRATRQRPEPKRRSSFTSATRSP